MKEERGNQRKQEKETEKGSKRKREEESEKELNILDECRRELKTAD